MLVELAGHADDDFCYLTTRGRVTGQPHEIEIWFALDGARIYLLAGGGTSSDWVRNLQAEPAVTVRIGATTYAGTARVVDPATDEDEHARTLVFDKFQPRSGGLERWRATALPVAIELVETQS
jgi:deazaflavin-dependent oxidoreductase (nitroreductase family)